MRKGLRAGRLKSTYGVGLLLIGLVVGLALGFVLYPTLLVAPAVGKNNQVQVSGTVQNVRYSTLCFVNLNFTIETSAPINTVSGTYNGTYSVLLVGGQSYEVFSDYCPPVSTVRSTTSDYNPFYVPLGVTTFTENLVYAP
jgi:hypothetical protein